MKYSRWILALFAAVVFSAVVVFLSWYVNYQRVQASSHDFALIRGQSMFHLVETVRAWNAGHAGVYVPSTEVTPPNSYLSTPDRSVSDSLGRQLTKVNPAYMTRQLSALLTGSGIETSLSSLDPINPDNAPDDWERKALEHFKAGQLSEHLEVVGDNYRYIAPLYITEACLRCHAPFGYKLGDVRGGLSFKFPVSHTARLIERQVKSLTQFHLLLFMVLMGLALALWVSVRLLQGKLKISQDRRKVLEEEVRIDGLTGMLNHNAIVTVLGDEWKRVQRSHQDLSVIMFDLDFFKKVNDNYGHLAGDKVLKDVAARINLYLREIDSLGRYGGEEFMAVLPDTSLGDAAIVAERIRQEIENSEFAVPAAEGVIDISVTASFGVAEFQLSGCELSEALISLADQALYYAKQQGRNRVATQLDIV